MKAITVIFTNELARLHDELEACEDVHMKTHIKSDITLLKEAIKQCRQGETSLSVR